MSQETRSRIQAVIAYVLLGAVAVAFGYYIWSL